MRWRERDIVPIPEKEVINRRGRESRERDLSRKRFSFFENRERGARERNGTAVERERHTHTHTRQSGGRGQRRV